MNSTAKKGLILVIMVSVIITIGYYRYFGYNDPSLPDGTEKPLQVAWDALLEHSLVISPQYLEKSIVAITKNKITVFDVETGTKKWTSPVAPLGVRPQYVNGLLLVGTDKGAAAFNMETGEKIWDKSFGGGAYCSFTGQYMVVDISEDENENAHVYVGTPEPAVYKLDAATGTILWEYTQNLHTCPRLQLVENRIFVYSGGIQCINQENSQKIWEISDYMPGIEYHGDVLLVKGVDKNGKFYHGIIDSRSGEFLWQENREIFNITYKNKMVYFNSEKTVEGVKIEKEIEQEKEFWEYAYEGSLHNILPFDTKVLLTIYTQEYTTLVVLNNNGEKIWTFKEDTISPVHIKVCDNTIIFATETGVIRALSIENGEKLWDNTLKTPSKIGNIIYYKNKIFLSTGEGVYSFDKTTGESWWEYSFGTIYDHPAQLVHVDDILLVVTQNKIVCIHFPH